MKQLFILAGQVLAILGVLLCAAAGLMRLWGDYSWLNFEMITVFQGGMGLMVAACVIKLYLPTQE